MIQETFLALIKKQILPKSSLTEEVATALDISYDASHRRISKKSKLSLSEGVVLAKYFGVSIDQLFSSEEEHIVAVKKTAPVRNEESLLAFFQNSYQSLQPLLHHPEVEMIYAAKDIPLFYTANDTLLSKFKIYVWLKIVDPSFQTKTFDNFTPSLSLLEASNRFGKLYDTINSIEIWDITTINSPLKQVHFYFESGVLNAQDALEICNNLDTLIHEIAKKIIEQKEKFKFYSNEVLLLNNRVLVKTPKELALYIPCDILSYYRTNDVLTCNQADEFLKTQMNNSMLLTTAGEKERKQFFNKMYKKIEALRTLILAKNVLEFE